MKHKQLTLPTEKNEEYFYDGKTPKQRFNNRINCSTCKVCLSPIDREYRTMIMEALFWNRNE
jgi:hypothetical protein